MRMLRCKAAFERGLKTTFTGTFIRQFAPIHWSLRNGVSAVTDILQRGIYDIDIRLKKLTRFNSF